MDVLQEQGLSQLYLSETIWHIILYKWSKVSTLYWLLFAIYIGYLFTIMYWKDKWQVFIAWFCFYFILELIQSFSNFRNWKSNFDIWNLLQVLNLVALASTGICYILYTPFDSSSRLSYTCVVFLSWFLLNQQLRVYTNYRFILEFFLVSIWDAGWIACLLVVFFLTASFAYESTFMTCTKAILSSDEFPLWREQCTFAASDLLEAADGTQITVYPDTNYDIAYEGAELGTRPNMAGVATMMWYMVFGDFGGYADLGPLTNERLALFFLVSFVLPLIITNLFIALVSGESFSTVQDVRHLRDWQSFLDIIKEYELLMFWNKCASNKQIIIMGQPGAEGE